MQCHFIDPPIHQFIAYLTVDKILPNKILRMGWIFTVIASHPITATSTPTDDIFFGSEALSLCGYDYVVVGSLSRRVCDVDILVLKPLKSAPQLKAGL